MEPDLRLARGLRWLQALAILVAGIGSAFGGLVVPSYQGLYTELGMELPAATAAVLEGSRAWPALLAGAGLLVLAAQRSRRRALAGLGPGRDRAWRILGHAITLAAIACALGTTVALHLPLLSLVDSLC